MHTALDAIERGYGCDENRHTLAAGINIAGSVAMNVHGGDAILPLIDTAKESIISMDERFIRVGKWGMSAPEMKAIRQAVLAYSQLIRRTNSATLEAAIRHVYAANRESGATLGSHKHPVERVAA